MKVVAIILLVGLVVASVVCEPEEPEVETERKHRHKHRDYKDDDYSKSGSGSYPRNCPTCPAKLQTCTCQQTLAANPLSSANGCVNTPGAANTNTCAGGLNGIATSTGFCTDSTTAPNRFPDLCLVNNGNCVTPASLGTTAAAPVTVGACNGNQLAPNNANPSSLCYEIKCPSAGWINIKADSVPIGCCGAAATIADFVYLFKNTNNQNPTISTTPLVGGALGVMNLDYSAQCDANDVFWVCERNGILITSTIKATFTTQPTGITTCPPVTGQSVFTLVCRSN
jgi:hypothetical protein